MSRISREELIKAVSTIRAMDFAKKEKLVDEIYIHQPNLLASVVVQKQLGVSLEKINFLIEILLVCYQSMKETGINWPVISIEEQDRQLSRYAASVEFTKGLSRELESKAILNYSENHPEQYLIAYVCGEMVNWLKCISSEESDKYVILTAMNIVNCIAHVLMPEPHHHFHPTSFIGE